MTEETLVFEGKVEGEVVEAKVKEGSLLSQGKLVLLYKEKAAPNTVVKFKSVVMGRVVRLLARPGDILTPGTTPVLRFTDAGFGADVRIKDIGPPEKLLGGFAPEILGGPLEDRDLESTVISSKETPVGELDFYNWVTNRPRAIMSATSYKNRAFVLCVKASALQWRKNEEALRKIGDSFSIVA